VHHPTQTPPQPISCSLFDGAPASLPLSPPPPLCSDHWRKNTPILGQQFKTYAIDLLGYGFSDKPNPRTAEPNSIYNFENWGGQLTDFIEEVIGQPAYISTNSVGGEEAKAGRHVGTQYSNWGQSRNLGSSQRAKGS
jgi:pimeloyl-ACP methyl ester carboxylesterase